MSIVSKKNRLLLAMYTTLKEYKKKTHRTSIGTCKLCHEFYDDDVEFVDETGKVNTCYKCPMMVFFNSDRRNQLPCLNRKCRPVGCTFEKSNLGYPKEFLLTLKRVIKFYELAINKVESMSDRQVRESSFNFLIKIDQNIDEKFKIKY